MFYKQKRILDTSIWCFSIGAAAPIDETEHVQDSRGQAYLDFDPTPSLFE